MGRSVRHALLLGLIILLSSSRSLEKVVVHAAFVYGVDSYDKAGLSALIDKFLILNLWYGNPCVDGYVWDWVECSSDDPPRITALDLRGYGLYGKLPDFRGMDALETIDLHNNSLYGSIPEFLGKLPNLKELDLSNNDFSGTVPASISDNAKINLVVSGNPRLCSSGNSCSTTSSTSSLSDASSGDSASSRSSKKSDDKWKIIVGAATAAFCALWVVVGVIVIMQHRHRSQAIAAAGAGKQGGITNNTAEGMGVQGGAAAGVMGTGQVEVAEHGAHNRQESPADRDHLPLNP